MRVNHFRKRAQRRAMLMGAGATSLALLLPGAAQAQDSQPSVYSSAMRYDGAGRLVGTIAADPDGAGPLGHAATRTSYNAVGQKVKVESGELSAWQPTSVAPNAWPGFTILETQDFAYDTMGRLVRTRKMGSDGQIAAVADTNYDRVGRPACTAVRMNPGAFGTLPANACSPGTTGAQGPDRIERIYYDSAGQVTKVQKAYGTALVQDYASYTYSANGQQLSVTDANNNRAEFRYDGHGRQSHWFFPAKAGAGQTDYSDYEQYGYDENGNRTSLRKRDGSILSYQYDALSRMTAKFVPERAGLTTAQTRDVFYEYDLRGLQTKARFDSLAGEGVTSTYDGFGRLLSSSSNMGGVARTIGHVYDANGARVRVTHPDGSFFTYDQDGLDRPTLIRENGGDPIASFTYDRAGRRARTGWAAATDYAYDPAGRLQTLSHDMAGTSRDHVLGFAYNSASQIVARSASNDAYAWTGAANVSRLYTVNRLNQYTSAGPATFDYDPNGNLALTVNAPWSTNYIYDVENRLVSATGTHAAELVYDPLGRLSQVSSGGANIRRLVYDGDALVAEYEPGGYMVHRYIHGTDGQADNPLIWYDNLNSGWRRALVADHQGSIIQVADMYGSPIGTNSYDPWGLPGGTPSGRFGYTGQTWVPELGLWYYKARFYSPTLGRFLQTDPIGYEDNVNLYGYVGNDPVNANDPSGTQTYFWGGAGNADSAAYKPDFDRAFTAAGFEDFRPVPESATSPSGMIGDLGTLPLINNLTEASIYTRGVSKDGSAAQYNLIGYSYGAAAAAQQALHDAGRGTRVDNLVLIGAPINQDLYDAVRRNPNISRVVTVSLPGDPIFPGMPDWQIGAASPILGVQMARGTGHFFYAGGDRQSAARRNDLARRMRAIGLR